MATSYANTKLVCTHIPSAGVILLSVKITSWKSCIEFYISKAFVRMEVLILLSIGIGHSLMTFKFNIGKLFHPLPFIISCSTSSIFFFIHYSSITTELSFPLPLFPKPILVWKEQKHVQDNEGAALATSIASVWKEQDMHSQF